MTEAPGNKWPATLRIRDTKIHDDLGGSGRRIYTTAGNGYERMEYTRSDIANASIAELEAALGEVSQANTLSKAQIIARAALKDTPNDQ